MQQERNYAEELALYPSEDRLMWNAGYWDGAWDATEGRMRRISARHKLYRSGYTAGQVDGGAATVHSCNTAWGDRETCLPRTDTSASNVTRI